MKQKILEKLKELENLKLPKDTDDLYLSLGKTMYRLALNDVRVSLNEIYKFETIVEKLENSVNKYKDKK